MSIHKLYNGQIKEFASHVAITQANQALTVNGTAFNIADSSVITELDRRLSAIEDGGGGGGGGGEGDYLPTSISSDLSSDIATSTMMLPTGNAVNQYVDSVPWKSFPYDWAVSGVYTKVQVAYKEAYSSSSYFNGRCELTTQFDGWYLFETSGSTAMTSIIEVSNKPPAIVDFLATGCGPTWRHLAYIPANMYVRIFAPTNSTETAEGTRTIYFYRKDS